MEEKVMQTYLYDFYGELLTTHQQSIYEDFVLYDFTLSEIAEERGVSRQSIHDLVKRCNKILTDYEEKLHLVERFINIKEKITTIHKLTETFDGQNEAVLMTEIKQISNEILEELV